MESLASRDGFGDIAIGEYLDGAVVESAGRVHIVRGSSTGSHSEGDGIAIEIGGEANSDWFGATTSRGCDINADGRHDFVVGAPYYDGPGTNSGRAYLFRGENPLELPAGAGGADWIVSGDSAGDYLGQGLD